LTSRDRAGTPQRLARELLDARALDTSKESLLMSLRISLCATALAAALAGSVFAQAPPSPSPAKRAIDERKAIFTLIGGNFRPIGEQLQGRGSLGANAAREPHER